MTRLLIPLVTLAIFALVPWVGHPQSTKGIQPLEPALAKVLTAWDKNKNKLFDRDEVDTAVLDPRVKGQAAVIAASLHSWFLNAKDKETVSPDELLKPLITMVKSKTGNEETETFKFQNDYQANIKQLTNLPRKAFVGNAPKLIGINQGQLGDCFFVAVAGAYAHLHPNLVRKMIHPKGGDVYEVVFPDGRKTQVPHVTDAIICLGSTAQGQGIWINILEEAYGEVYKLDQLEKGNTKVKKIGIDAISSGGSGPKSIELFTGKKPETFSCNNKDLDLLKKKLANGSKEKKIICTNVSSTPQVSPPGIVRNHEYALLEYDPKNEMLIIWNPHGNTFYPEGPDGLENGYKKVNGIFQIPFQEFIQVFSSFSIETK